jgi:ATP-dependent DNA helicase PIF1
MDMNTLNEEQQHAVDAVMSGKSIFLTGPAGSGKSYTIHAIREWCESVNKKMALTAMTGVAALLINGTTLHSYLGIGLAKGEVIDMIREPGAKFAKMRLASTNLLVIDEVSMLSAELFEKIDMYVRLLLGVDRPFAGIQLVLCGDMHQLKSVDGSYIFRSPLWHQVVSESVILRQNVRQADDLQLQRILMEMRSGEALSKEAIKLLKSRVVNVKEEPMYEEDKIRPVLLFPVLRSVDEYNQRVYQQLPHKDESRTYALQVVSGAPARVMAMAKTLKLPESVTLCPGAQVMLTYNMSVEGRLVNGSTGIVKSVDPDGVDVTFKDGMVCKITYINKILEDKKDGKKRITTAACRYVPLVLAFAISIHKSQGCTIDAVQIDLGRTVFAPGQAYTALSRVRSLDGVAITNFHRRSLFMDAEVVEFYKRLETE